MTRLSVMLRLGGVIASTSLAGLALVDYCMVEP